MSDPTKFNGEIRVASRIVDYLSSGLYKSPSACLKELINNSFDADALQVNIYIKPDADRIIIEDNGHGMDRDDFIKHFSVISESHKREDSDISPMGRPKIGKIGIGFIAANEICNEMQILSTKNGSSELLNVTINFDLMRQDPSKRRRDSKEIAKADYIGHVKETDRNTHFTQIFLKKIRGEAKSILVGGDISKYASGTNTLYGLKPESVFSRLREKQLNSWSEFDFYTKNMLEVALNVPVQYHNHWIPDVINLNIKQIQNQVSRLNFHVIFDGTDIRKPIVYKPGIKYIISDFKYKGENVAAKGYFYCQHGAIKPQEIQGVLIRIRNAAVGEYDPSFLGYSPSRGPLFQSWISGEIFADDRLEEAMNIDRHTLRVSHPAYVELQNAIHTHLSGLIKRVREEIYGVGRDVRAEERVETLKNKIMSVVVRDLAEVAPVAAKEMQVLWEKVAQEKPNKNRLLKKYSVDELYSIVIKTAKEILPPELLDKFIARLTDYLGE